MFDEKNVLLECLTKIFCAAGFKMKILRYNFIGDPCMENRLLTVETEHIQVQNCATCTTGMIGRQSNTEILIFCFKTVMGVRGLNRVFADVQYSSADLRCLACAICFRKSFHLPNTSADT